MDLLGTDGVNSKNNKDLDIVLFLNVFYLTKIFYGKILTEQQRIHK